MGKNWTPRTGSATNRKQDSIIPALFEEGDTVYRSYRGYAVTHQRRLADGSEEVDPDSAAYRKRAKTARHCVRVLVQGAQLLRTGALTVSMTDHLDLLQAAERDVNTSVGSFHTTVDQLQDTLADATQHSVLPDASDRAAANAVVVAMRLAQLERA